MPQACPRFLSTVLVMLAAALAGCAAASPRQAALEGARGELVALVFVSHECPVANAMVPDLIELAEEAARLDIRFTAVNATSWADEATMAEHARRFGTEGKYAVVRDPRQELARSVGATVVPEAALLRLDGAGGFELLYLGRVNDLYAAIGRRRAVATTDDLASAMRAAREGRPIPQPFPKAVGCFIER